MFVHTLQTVMKPWLAFLHHPRPIAINAFKIDSPTWPSDGSVPRGLSNQPSPGVFTTAAVKTNIPQLPKPIKVEGAQMQYLAGQLLLCLQLLEQLLAGTAAQRLVGSFAHQGFRQGLSGAWAVRMTELQDELLGNACSDLVARLRQIAESHPFLLKGSEVVTRFDIPLPDAGRSAMDYEAGDSDVSSSLLISLGPTLTISSGFSRHLVNSLTFCQLVSRFGQ